MRKIRIGSDQLLFALFGTVLLLAATNVHAHHGWSAYDADTLIKAEATIEAVRYQNPHGDIEITYEGKKWLVVLAPPSRMTARGLPKEDLTVGTVVTVEGYPSKTGDAELRAERIMVKGKTIELR